MVERFGPEDSEGRPSWHLRSFGSCDLKRDLGDLPVDVLLDPATPATPGAERVALLVIERACASGRPATDRIRAVEARFTDEELQLVLGVEPLDGDQICPEDRLTDRDCSHALPVYMDTIGRTPLDGGTSWRGR